MLASEALDSGWTLAADIMQGPVTVCPDDDLSTAIRELLTNELRQIAVVDHDGQLLGVLDEVRVAEAYFRAVARDDGDVER